MSRENKLALIIGFGLVLFVGVLISDHLSEANRLVTADLARAIDPLVDEDEDTPLVEFGPVGPRLAGPEDHPTALPTKSTHPLHVVEEGETLRTIARSWYGDDSMAITLAAHNNLPDPDRLVPGTRLLMPTSPPGDVAELTITMGQPAPITPPAAIAEDEPDSLEVYTVKPGDTLSQLAQKLLGSSRDTGRLFEMNRDVIGNIDALQVGMELRYPRSSS
ncbi:MAG TPA: hypothetical protein DEO57_08585 [Phycisphaerales bacterium]|nr:hypothetical protein [Phycisphaerales bacterium]